MRLLNPPHKTPVAGISHATLRVSRVPKCGYSNTHTNLSPFRSTTRHNARHNYANMSRNAIASTEDAAPDREHLAGHNKLTRRAGDRPSSYSACNRPIALITKGMRDTVAVSTECEIGGGRPA
jgi:hypothetical protein